MRISKRAFDLIVREEVSSEAYYRKHYTHPEWPGTRSGVTVGIGYDLGYASPHKISHDWSERLPPDTVSLMTACSGVKGEAARQMLPRVRPGIMVPWEPAIEVFSLRDIPNWTARVIKSIPKAASLSPDCLGTLVSIAYNRGPSFDQAGDRYREMRAIKDHIEQGHLDRIPAEIRSMKRLWPNVRGLQNRREHEAALFEEGLLRRGPVADVPDTPGAPDPDLPLNEGPARTKPPATSTAQNGTTGTIAAGGIVGAILARVSGFLSTEAAIFIAFLALLAAFTVFWIWYRNRNPK